MSAPQGGCSHESLTACRSHSPRSGCSAQLSCYLHAHGFIAEIRRNRAGKVSVMFARAMVTAPSSRGWRTVPERCVGIPAIRPGTAPRYVPDLLRPAAASPILRRSIPRLKPNDAANGTAGLQAGRRPWAECRRRCVLASFPAPRETITEEECPKFSSPASSCPTPAARPEARYDSRPRRLRWRASPSPARAHRENRALPPDL